MSRNATKHSLHSKELLLKGDSAAQFLDLLRCLQEYFQPQGTVEEILVERLATLSWLGQRMREFELLLPKPDNHKKGERK